jgi:hypothetical protein
MKDTAWNIVINLKRKLADKKRSDSLLRTLQHPLDTPSLEAGLRSVKSTKPSASAVNTLRKYCAAPDSSTQVQKEIKE